MKKKILTGLLAAAVAVLATAPAFAATTVAQGATNSITISSYISKQDKIITMKSEDGSTDSEPTTVYEVSAGTVVALQKTGAMIYGVAKQDTDGTYVSSGEFGAVESSYTIPASMEDKTLFFITNPNDEGEYAEPLIFVCHVVSTQTYKSDTTQPVFLGHGASYTFRITSLNGKKPTFSSGGNAFRVSLVGVKGNDYYYKVTAVGKNGDCNGIYVNGEKIPVCVMTIRNVLKSDTTQPVFLGQGASYTFKITSLDGNKPTFDCGGNAFRVLFVAAKGDDYYYKVTAVGKNGDCNGIYLNGEKTPVCVMTIRNVLKSDTGKTLKVQTGKTYQFKITANCGKPTFVCGSGSVFTVRYNGQKGNDYFFIVKAVGKAGQSAGFYLNGAKTPSTVGTVS